MNITLKEACAHTSVEVSIWRDCSFEALYLVGKPYPNGKHTVSFLAVPKYIPEFLGYDIDGVICTKEAAAALDGVYEGGIAVCTDPKTAFFEIHNYYAKKNASAAPAQIDETAQIHPTAIIAGHDVVIGAHTEIRPHVVIEAGTTIGSGCVIREGCVLGAPAFYYYGTGDRKTAVISTGTVEIGNNVELHTQVVVEKGALGGPTRIGSNTKIDNLCLIGHDSQVGENVTIAGSTTLAGGVEIGDGSTLGVGVTVAPYVKCGKDVKFSVGAAASKDVPDGMHVSGNFAIEHSKYLKHIKSIAK